MAHAHALVADVLRLGEELTQAPSGAAPDRVDRVVFRETIQPSDTEPIHGAC
jgi:hypothetical protein